MLSLVMSVFHFIQFGDVKFVFFSVYIALAHRVPIFIFVYFVYIIYSVDTPRASFTRFCCW